VDIEGKESKQGKQGEESKAVKKDEEVKEGRKKRYTSEVVEQRLPIGPFLTRSIKPGSMEFKSDLPRVLTTPTQSKTRRWHGVEDLRESLLKEIRQTITEPGSSDEVLGITDEVAFAWLRRYMDEDAEPTESISVPEAAEKQIDKILKKIQRRVSRAGRQIQKWERDGTWPADEEVAEAEEVLLEGADLVRNVLPSQGERTQSLEGLSREKRQAGIARVAEVIPEFLEDFTENRLARTGEQPGFDLAFDLPDVLGPDGAAATAARLLEETKDPGCELLAKSITYILSPSGFAIINDLTKAVAKSMAWGRLHRLGEKARLAVESLDGGS
jgi:hypothetical protein